MPRPSVSSMLFAGVLLAACGFLTDVDPLTISLRIATFDTPEERAAWPEAPIVEGGTALVVRGWAYPLGCNRPEAHVQKRDNVVGVEIRAVYTGQICPAMLYSYPVEATVSGLAPGVYRVRVGMVGVPQRAEGTATIAAP